jgi:molybdopterin molybdotransferase
MPISFEEARDTILESTTVLEHEHVPLLATAGRVLARDFAAPWALPLWDNSAMDGFALCAADAAVGKELKIQGYIPAGATELAPVSPGIAVRIMTGAPTPPGCDLVVPVEETEETGERMKLLHNQAVGAHIRFRGEDIKAGEKALVAGTRLRPAEISLLASFNQSEVCVYRQPQVAILSTGDELVDIGTAPGVGQIMNSNSYALAAAVREAGGVPRLLGIARDTSESHREKLAEGLEADVLVTSAGVSAGDRDLVRDVLAELGVEQKFWKVDIKPGRPTAFAVKGNTLVFSLPGNPVSSMITFEEFVRPCLLKMQGRRQALKPCVKVRLRKGYSKKPGRVQFLRVQVVNDAGQLVAVSAGDQNTGILSTLLRANAIAILPTERGNFAAGEELDAHLLDVDSEL